MGELTRNLSFGEIFAVCVFLGALLLLLGAVTNAILRDRGLGTIGNALLMLLGGAAGVWTKVLISGPLGSGGG